MHAGVRQLSEVERRPRKAIAAYRPDEHWLWRLCRIRPRKCSHRVVAYDGEGCVGRGGRQRGAYLYQAPGTGQRFLAHAGGGQWLLGN